MKGLDVFHNEEHIQSGYHLILKKDKKKNRPQLFLLSFIVFIQLGFFFTRDSNKIQEANMSFTDHAKLNTNPGFFMGEDESY